MKKLILTLLLIIPLTSFAAGNSVNLQRVSIDMDDFESIQKGAQHYVTYCLGCHSIKYMRYKRIALDLEIDETKVLADIAPEGANIYDPLLSAMNAHDAQKWFGTVPPDLSLIGRSRGGDWLYTYLRGFYIDESKPLGVNNTVFEDVGMPNMLWQLQGIQTPKKQHVVGKEIITHLKMSEPGTMSRKEFDQFVTELVNFLVYVGEPIQRERESLGKYVIFFLLIFTFLAYLLKKEYWKDIHH